MTKENSTEIFRGYFQSPLGVLGIAVEEDALMEIFFDPKIEGRETRHPLIAETKSQLAKYFDRKLKSFDLPLKPRGSDFQIRVWNELKKIPFGKTISYLEFARRLGDEKAIRAAASANGKNPIAVIVPCHRVIGSNGSLVGYGGGLWRKKWLIEMESGNEQQTIF
jgi:methylated-DNA-[protein]-cysteine S-methyltransferase